MIRYILSLSIALSACTLSDSFEIDQTQKLVHESKTADELLRDKNTPLIFTSTYFLQDLLKQSLNNMQNWQVNLVYNDRQQDPANDMPNDEVIERLQDAQAIILNGARFEKGLMGVDLPRYLTVKTAQEFKSEWLSYPKSFVQSHQHGQSKSHNHTGIDGHTWMSPIRLKTQYKVLVKRLALLKLNLDSQLVQVVNKQIDHLHQKWTELARNIKQNQVCVVASHPAYQYIAHDYAFEIKHFDIDPKLDAKQIGQELDNVQLKALAKLCSDRERLKLLWWESKPQAAVLDRLKKSAFQHVTIRPLEQAPETNKLGTKPNIFTAIHSDLDHLEKVLP